jgi:hypothetical protein
MASITVMTVIFPPGDNNARAACIDWLAMAP